MQVRVLYLGMLRELAGCEREVVQLRHEASLAELYADLRRRLPKLQDFRGAIALAVNYEYSTGSTILRDNDEVALIPPVSGGSEEEPAKTKLPLTSPHASLVGDPIDAGAIQSRIKRPEDGAVAAFDGIVRNNSRGRKTLYLDYTGYEVMALRKMEQLAIEALGRFDVRDLRIVHRLGRLQVGETSVYIAVSSAHRAA